MKKTMLLVTAVVLVGTAALGQLRITSFNSSGELAWTNSIYRGFYAIERAGSPAGPWDLIDTVTDLDWASSNLITTQVPLTNAQAIYRVAWIPPDASGVWDYQGYDRDGMLVITGRLTLLMGNRLGTNPVTYQVSGSWNLHYAGPPTNEFWWLGPQIGTGQLGGSVAVPYSWLSLGWPSNVSDDNLQLWGTLCPNSYTGTWFHYTLAGPQGGAFSAGRFPTSQINSVQQKLLKQKGPSP